MNLFQHCLLFHAVERTDGISRESESFFAAWPDFRR